MTRPIFVLLALLSLFTSAVHSENLVREGDVVAICGDSITEAKQYSLFIEDYLLMCQPARVTVMQFGWSGETSWGFAARQGKDVLIFKPTLATTCYGMNDGGYKPIEDVTRQKYRDAMTKVVEQFEAAGARVVVGSPGAVDPATFIRVTYPPGDVYNQALAALRDEAAAVAEATGNTFADVHSPMIAAMQAAKAKYGDAYHVGGGDGVHPSANGHVVMAYAFLKALGFDGDLGTISIDLTKNAAEATGDHRVAGVQNGEVTVVSTRYPFCFSGDPANPAATAGIIEFVPFNQDLNRLTLKVAGDAPKYRITWGKTSKEFTADELAAGVNLAAEFLDNPFSGPFRAVEQKVREKQVFETKAFKALVHTLQEFRPTLNDDAAVDGIIEKIRQRHAELAAGVRDAVQPVTHVIKVETAE